MLQATNLVNVKPTVLLCSCGFAAFLERYHTNPAAHVAPRYASCQLEAVTVFYAHASDMFLPYFIDKCNLSVLLGRYYSSSINGISIIFFCDDVFATFGL